MHCLAKKTQSDDDDHDDANNDDIQVNISWFSSGVDDDNNNKDDPSRIQSDEDDNDVCNHDCNHDYDDNDNNNTPCNPPAKTPPDEHDHNDNGDDNTTCDPPARTPPDEDGPKNYFEYDLLDGDYFDYDLYGRSREDRDGSDRGNYASYYGPDGVHDGYDSIPQESKFGNKAFVVMGVALVAVLMGSFAYYAENQLLIDSTIMSSTALMTPEQKMAHRYGVGQIGSDHTHAAMVVFVEGEMIDFTPPQFQLQSSYIHFENHDPHIVHKHATKAVMTMLFASMGLEVTRNCIGPVGMSGASEGFCIMSPGDFAVFVVNGKYYGDIGMYEIQHNDRILISYGDPKLVAEQLQYLASIDIPDLPTADRLAPGKDISI